MRHIDPIKTLLLTKFTALFLLLLLLGTLIAGCGGGGGGGGGGQGSNSGGTIAIEGTVLQTGSGTSSGTPLVGWYVAFDGNQKVQTQSGGAFTLEVPANSITGSDTLTVLDPSNDLEGVFQFDFNEISGNPKVLPSPLTVGPPVPPSTLARRPA